MEVTTISEVVNILVTLSKDETWKHILNCVSLFNHTIESIRITMPPHARYFRLQCLKVAPWRVILWQWHWTECDIYSHHERYFNSPQKRHFGAICIENKQALVKHRTDSSMSFIPCKALITPPCDLLTKYSNSRIDLGTRCIHSMPPP